MVEIPSTASEIVPRGPRKILLVQAKDSLFRPILANIKFASKRATFITATPPGKVDQELQWASQRREPFDLVIIEAMKENEIEESFKLATRIKLQNANNPLPLIALSLAEIDWVRKMYTNKQVANKGVDYITDCLGEEQGLRSLLLFSEEWS